VHRLVVAGIGDPGVDLGDRPVRDGGRVAAAPPGVTAVILAPSDVVAVEEGEAALLLLREAPRTAWVDWPVVISSCAIRWAWSMGMAKPSPIDPDWVPAELAVPREAIAELMPISWPLRFTRAPPELPGLIAASVWMASSTEVCPLPAPPALTGRFGRHHHPHRRARTITGYPAVAGNAVHGPR